METDAAREVAVMHTNMKEIMRDVNSWTVERRSKVPAPFVTISREAGAFGRQLAGEILSDFSRGRSGELFKGWRVFDKEVCAQLAENPKTAASLRMLLAEQYHGAVEDFFFQLIAGTPPQYGVYSGMFKTVRAIAMSGKAVIVGRAAACYTRDIRGGVHVRLVAPEKMRIENIARLDGLSTADARRRVRALDESRAKMARSIFRKDIADPRLYDVVWNMERLSTAAVASAVAALVEAKSAEIAKGV